MCILLSGLLLYTIGRAKTGDTTHVVVMDKYLWINHGEKDTWTVFPDQTKSYEKILLRYTLTCPTGGCGEWDYTTGVILRKHTGRLDSTLRDAPSFTVDGNILDSTKLSFDTTKTYSYNKSKKRTDSTVNTPHKIYFYRDMRDGVHAFTPTDSIIAWDASYWNHIYDNTGKAIDSFFVGADTTLHLVKTKVYVVFEVLIPYELTRYITPYGKAFPKDWTRTWTMDVTDFAFLLHDSVDLRSYYDGYSQGSLYTLSFDFIEGTPSRKTYRADLIYNGYFTYGNENDPINDHLPPYKLLFEPAADLITLRLIVSGHGSDNNGACEFIDKTHSILVGGAEKYSQHLWREDCGQNYSYPQTGTFWFSRAGWCPGDLVFPWDYDLTAYGKKGDSLTVQYQMEDYISPNPSGGYNVHGIVFYSKGPSFNSDAAIEDIMQPNDDPRFVRHNPVCPKSPPIIVIRNNGKQPLTSLAIHYGIDGTEDHTYQWTGNLKFLEKTEVSLPSILLEVGTHTFSASCGPDEYSNNDRVTVTYTMAKGYSNKIALALKTDKYPASFGIGNGIRWELKNGNGVVFRTGGGYKDATQIRDTFELINDCYSFTIYDETMGDGLLPGGFWAADGATNGSYSLRDDKNAYIVNHGGTNSAGEFGAFETTTFFVGAPSDVGETSELPPLDFSVYPNPAVGKITLTIPSATELVGATSLTIFSVLGEEVFTRTISTGEPRVELDLSTLPPGSYIVRLAVGNRKVSKKLLLQ